MTRSRVMHIMTEMMVIVMLFISQAESWSSRILAQGLAQRGLRLGLGQCPQTEERCGVAAMTEDQYVVCGAGVALSTGRRRGGPSIGRGPPLQSVS